MRDLVQRDGDGWRAPAASPGAHLVEPLEKAGLLASCRRLYVVAHGVLHHLLFSLLLVAGGRLLVERYDLTLLPAAGPLALAVPPRRPPGTVPAVAPRCSRLRYAEAEARAVAGAHPEPRGLLVGEAATESAFKAGSPGYRVLHLATHSRWNRLNPLLSGLELEPSPDDDGRLEVHEILGLRLHAEVVALSACETALGTDLLGSVPAGDDFVGVTRAFLHAGSGAVLASLWEVDDRSTPALMRAFYERLGPDGPAGALASAQRRMLGGSDAALRRPYHWAAFVLVGDRGSIATTSRATHVSVKGR